MPINFAELYGAERAELCWWWLKCVIEDSWDTLNDWEQQFVTSCEAQFTRNATLSDRQLEVLEKLYER
jgi:hypothetical protein